MAITVLKSPLSLKKDGQVSRQSCRSPIHHVILGEPNMASEFLPIELDGFFLIIAPPAEAAATG